MKTLLLALMLTLWASHLAHSQIIYLTVTAISKSTKGADKKLMMDLKGSWIVTTAEINGQDVSGEFEGVVLTFPKCKGKAVSAGECEVQVTGDDNTQYFKQLLGEDPSLSITSRKEINQAAKAEDSEYEKVKYEIVQTGGSEYEFSFKYKKGRVVIQTVGEKGDEYFELARPPKEKKKK